MILYEARQSKKFESDKEQVLVKVKGSVLVISEENFTKEFEDVLDAMNLPFSQAYNLRTLITAVDFSTFMKAMKSDSKVKSLIETGKPLTKKAFLDRAELLASVIWDKGKDSMTWTIKGS